MQNDIPSISALKVALGIVTLGATPSLKDRLPDGVIEATEALLLACDLVSENSLAFSRSPNMFCVYQSCDWMLPGQFAAFAERKSFCERHVRECIRLGAQQVLVLGAGYDTLSWRLTAEFPEVCFVEIDHPATMAVKQTGVAILGQPSNLMLLPADIGNPNLHRIVRESGRWDAQLRTAVVAEGVVMYLPEQTVRQLLACCFALTGAGSRFAFSFLPSDDNGQPAIGYSTYMMQWMQCLSGEPWRWHINPVLLTEFLYDHGWQCENELINPCQKHGVECYAIASKA